MSFFLGFDRSEYPGDDFMRSLKSQSQVSWTGFYLAPAPSHSDTSWMQNRAFLQDLGFGFAPIYVGQQQLPGPGSHVLTTVQGQSDAGEAVDLAQQAGFPRSSVLYLDIECGPPATDKLFDYYVAWVQGIIDNGYSPGVYCSHLLAAEFLARDDRPVPWIFHLKFPNGHTFAPPLPMIDPAQSTFNGASMMQYAQNGKLVLDSTSIRPVDLNSGLVEDPSIKKYAGRI
ncbi:MAG TPA: glycoside hydrolase domain-containing protein [Blastocatellia bacterium]|nr:glycoside hydrolase domain-containing protein [Blastocatellia bacterium]